MKTDRPFRVGIFRSRTDAERVANEARQAGFTNVRIISGGRSRAYRRDPGEMPGTVEDITPPSLSKPARRLPLEGMAVGLVLGFVGAWTLGAFGVLDLTVGFLVLPVAGVIFCGLIGAMLTRGFTDEPENFYDQEVPPGSFLVAIEEFDPLRLELAERILCGAGAAPIPLEEG